MLSQQVSANLWILRSQKLRLILDLQFRSIVFALKDFVKTWPAQGRVLDFGAGTQPYRQWIPAGWTYTSVDSAAPADARQISQLPLTKNFDRILLIEVLEHIENPPALLKELREALSEKGELVISVPFAARVHPFPSDFLRWTPEGLQRLLESNGFHILELRTRGSDFATLTSKAIYFFARRKGFNLTSLVGLVFSPWLTLALCWCQLRSSTLPAHAEDPLGYILRATKIRH